MSTPGNLRGHYSFGLTRFDPWVGCHYAGENGWRGRLLILGESHHSTDQEEPRNLTIELTRSYINHDYAPGTFNTRFWTTIASTVTGKPQVDRREFWESVAFYNYVPAIVGEYSRVRPTRELWSLGRGPFLEVLEKLAPQWILVLGEQLWSNMPADGGQGPDLLSEGATRDTWLYPTGSAAPSLAMRIPHPTSRGFSWNRWHPWVRVLMQANSP